MSKPQMGERSNSKKKKRPMKGDINFRKHPKQKTKKSQLKKAAKEAGGDVQRKALSGVKMTKGAKKHKKPQMTEAGANQSAVDIAVDRGNTTRKPSKRKTINDLVPRETAKKIKVNEKHQEGSSGSQTEKTDSVTKLTRKQRRNRKKNNSKKNKYKHLALNKAHSVTVDGNEKKVAVSHVLADNPNSKSKAKLKSELSVMSPSTKKQKKKMKNGTGHKKKVNADSKTKAYQEVVSSKKKKKNGVSAQKTVSSEPPELAEGIELEEQDADYSESDEDSAWSTDEDFTDSDDSDTEDRLVTKSAQGVQSMTQSVKPTAPADKISQTTQLQKSKPLSFAEKARQKLNAARFRFLNEQLYTSTGKQALEMFKDDPEAFQVYHEGFQAQVARWPINPLDTIIKQLGKGNAGSVIADFGCGDGRLAESLPQQKVHSFDLVASKPFITPCNIARVPLEKSCVDTAVFCLSLMGTNLSDYLCEANRVLKQGGVLKIAEVVSRFYSVSNFVRNVEALGFKLQKKVFLGKMFLLFTFRKDQDASRKKAPRIQLKACHYKRR